MIFPPRRPFSTKSLVESGEQINHAHLEQGSANGECAFIIINEKLACSTANMASIRSVCAFSQLYKRMSKVLTML
jgi:hypothetical protein